METLGGKIEGAINTRKDERAAFDIQAEEAKEQINDYEAGQNQTFNELVFNLADNGRNKIAEWNAAAKRGEMTQADLKLKMNNLTTGVTGFSKSAKDFDARSLEMQTRNIEGKAGVLENELSLKFSSLANLKGKEVYITESGKTVIIERDKEGKVISQIDANRVNNPGNMLGVKVDLGAAIAGTVKFWEPHMIETAGRRGSSETIKGFDSVEGFSDSVLALTGSILSNDRSTFSVLADNSNVSYGLFTSDDDRETQVLAKIERARKSAEMAGKEFNEAEARSSAEDAMVELRQDATDVWQPIITDELKKRAEDIVVNAIKMQLGKTVSSIPERAPSPVTKPPKIGESGRYAAIKDAWTNADSDAMTQLARPGYIFKYLGKNNWQVNEDFDNSKSKVKNKTFTVTNARDLSKYIYPTTGSYYTDVFDKERKAYGNKNSGGGEGFNAQDFYNQNK
tara:strand:- start:3374 stop:4732 length:1359 start_codon:yes stop_codon:yes gene_type:complete